VGCEACAVACMDQHDLPVTRKEQGWRQVFRVESGSYPAADVVYVSLTCRHCVDAPCVTACPAHALGRDVATGAVEVAAERCIGCRSCAPACPFGIPRYAADGTMVKCDLCAARVAEGLLPACVRVCPTGALTFAEVESLAQQAEIRAAVRIAATALRGS
jgi:Fe-S-cluster-containing dehydrogenase component